LDNELLRQRRQQWDHSRHIFHGKSQQAQNFSFFPGGKQFSTQHLANGARGEIGLSNFVKLECPVVVWAFARNPTVTSGESPRGKCGSTGTTSCGMFALSQEPESAVCAPKGCRR
jgi:hypothetical protein